MNKLTIAVVFLIFSLLFSSLESTGQGMAINATGASADTSAILDLSSTQKGMLVPRMTQSQRDSIASPATGLMIYQTNGTTGFYYYNGSAWAAIGGAGTDTWGTQGNLGLTEYWSFLGTIDSTPVTFRVDSQFFGRFNAKTGNVSLGLRAGANFFPRPYSKDNIAFGRDAMVNVTQVNDNVAIGDSALLTCNSDFISGRDKNTGNIAIGKSTLGGYGGAANVAIGYECLAYGGGVFDFKYDNVAIGYQAARASTANANVAIGSQAMTNSTMSAWNVAMGATTLQNIKNGDQNVAIGARAMAGVDTSSNNVAIGYQALVGGYGHDGNSNTAIGNNSMGNFYDCSHNISIGNNASNSSMYSNYSIYIGEETALQAEGDGNIAIGKHALLYSFGVDFGSPLIGNNIAIGDSALLQNWAGTGNNIAIGKNSMVNFGSDMGASGIGNVAVGVYSMPNLLNGDNNTAVGYYAGPTGDYSNTTCIGNGATVGADNSIRLGNASVTSIGGQVGWSVLSDGRFKKGVRENVPGIDFVMKLRPVTYHFDANEFDKFTKVPDSVAKANVRNNILAMKRVRTGFIAQEVEKAASACNYDFSGVHKPESDKDHYTLSYEEFTVPLVKAVQEQQAQIDALKNENAELKKLLSELDKRVKSMEK